MEVLLHKLNFSLHIWMLDTLGVQSTQRFWRICLWHVVKTSCCVLWWHPAHSGQKFPWSSPELGAVLSSDKMGSTGTSSFVSRGLGEFVLAHAVCTCSPCNVVIDVLCSLF
jgi:hypothetical protein